MQVEAQAQTQKEMARGIVEGVGDEDEVRTQKPEDRMRNTGCGPNHTDTKARRGMVEEDEVRGEKLEARLQKLERRVPVRSRSQCLVALVV